MWEGLPKQSEKYLSRRFSGLHAKISLQSFRYLDSTGVVLVPIGRQVRNWMSCSRMDGFHILKEHSSFESVVPLLVLGV